MLVVSSLELSNDPVEIVHPDTIRDALAEALSRNLCREYRRCFGKVLHHNVGSWDLQAMRLATKDGVPVMRLQAVVEEVAVYHLSCIPHLIERFVTGTIEVY